MLYHDDCINECIWSQIALPSTLFHFLIISLEQDFIWFRSSMLLSFVYGLHGEWNIRFSYAVWYKYTCYMKLTICWSHTLSVAAAWALLCSLALSMLSLRWRANKTAAFIWESVIIHSKSSMINCSFVPTIEQSKEQRAAHENTVLYYKIWLSLSFPTIGQHKVIEFF